MIARLQPRTPAPALAAAVALAALATLVGGCSFSRPAPVKQAFLLEAPSPPPVAKPQPATLQGGTGLKSSLVDDLEAIVGQPRAVPLFSSYSKTGSGAKYTIVGFVGVTIVRAAGSGSHIDIVFQPTVLIDPTATFDTTSTTVTEFVYPQVPVVLVR